MKKTLILLVIMAFTAAAQAGLSFQARLNDSGGNPVPDGLYDITFRLYDVDTGGTPLWFENHTGVNQVQVTKGLYSVELGNINSLDTLDFKTEYWISVEVNSDGEMVPRYKLTEAPYAINAHFVNNVSPFPNTVIWGPQRITSDGDTALSVSNTAGTALFGGIFGTGIGAGLAGYSYSSSTQTTGVYGYAEYGPGIMGQSGQFGSSAIYGENSNSGTGVTGRGMTGVAATSNDINGIGLYVNNETGGTPMVVDGGNSVYFNGPGLSIDSAAYPAALFVSFTAGAWPAALIQAPNGQALKLIGSNGGLGSAILEIDKSPFASTFTGISVKGAGDVFSPGYGVSATAEGGTGVMGIGVTGVAAVAEDYDAGTALYAHGSSYMYGGVTIMAKYGADPMNPAVYAYNNAGTSEAIRAENSPGTSILGIGDIGVRGEGQMFGAEGVVTNTTGRGVHAVNQFATGSDDGAALYIEGKIKANGGLVAGSPVGKVQVLVSDGPNPSVQVDNNLCNGNFAVFITPMSSGDPVTANNKPISWWVETISGGFILHIEGDGQPLDFDSEFSYLIVNM